MASFFNKNKPPKNNTPAPSGSIKIQADLDGIKASIAAKRDTIKAFNLEKKELSEKLPWLTTVAGTQTRLHNESITKRDNNAHIISICPSNIREIAKYELIKKCKELGRENNISKCKLEKYNRSLHNSVELWVQGKPVRMRQNIHHGRDKDIDVYRTAPVTSEIRNCASYNNKRGGLIKAVGDTDVLMKTAISDKDKAEKRISYIDGRVTVLNDEISAQSKEMVVMQNAFYKARAEETRNAEILEEQRLENKRKADEKARLAKAAIAAEKTRLEREAAEAKANADAIRKNQLAQAEADRQQIKRVTEGSIAKNLQEPTTDNTVTKGMLAIGGLAAIGMIIYIIKK